jgi:AraC-like DNA-binding protein
MGLPGKIPASSELFASALTIYEIVEECAFAADDPYLGYTIGQDLDLTQWDPIAKALGDADTVGDLLRYFVVNALEHSSSTEFFVRTKGNRSTFGFTRVVTPTFTPAQNDAFYFSFLGKLLRQATGPHWDPLQVLATISYPKAIPPGMENPRIAQGDNGGMQFSFPTVWQFSTLRKSAFSVSQNLTNEQQFPNSLIHSVRSALRPHLHEPMRIAEIGSAVGFKDPTVFSRAFKNWTTQSPQEYRRNHKS